MRFLLYSDPHWGQYSSIVRIRDANGFSRRLNVLVDTLNWVEETAESYNCDCVLCLGDFFDKESLNGEELTALNNINFLNISHGTLVGNHEMSSNNLSESSAHLFNLIPNYTVFDKPTAYDVDGVEICFLPYVLDRNIKTINEYFGEKTKTRVIFSHNDIKGIQMGQIVSTYGLEISDIADNSDIFFNGHLHNGAEIVPDKVINIGSICGMNFNEDAFKYAHNAVVFDTKTMTYAYIENPYSFNFYKVDLVGDFSYDRLNAISKSNAVVSFRVDEKNYDDLSKWLETAENIITYKIFTVAENGDIHETEQPEVLQVDHISQFKKYVHEHIGVSDIIDEELSKLGD